MGRISLSSKTVSFVIGSLYYSVWHQNGKPRWFLRAMGLCIYGLTGDGEQKKGEAKSLFTREQSVNVKYIAQDSLYWDCERHEGNWLWFWGSGPLILGKTVMKPCDPFRKISTYLLFPCTVRAIGGKDGRATQLRLFATIVRHGGWGEGRCPGAGAKSLGSGVR